MSAPQSPLPPVLLAGASGLVGGLCLDELLKPDQREVITVGRRALPVKHPRLRVLQAELDALVGRPPVTAGAALCALGTTIKKAGSREAFRAVDRDAVVTYSRWARTGGADVFVLVSSVGADSRAGNFYLRVKGEAEEAVTALGWRRLVILRPSLLLGDRVEPRPGESAARLVMPFINPLLLGGLRRFRGIQARTVARAMVAAINGPSGRHVWENTDLEAAGAL